MAALQRTVKLNRPIPDYLRGNLYVTASGTFSANHLQRCIEIVGVERILFSTDFPYQYRPGLTPGASSNARRWTRSGRRCSPTETGNA